MDLAHLPLDLAGLLALAAGLGWAAGLRLYTVIFVVGMAGAALAAMVFGGQGIEWQTAMAIMGGTLAAGTHFTKAGARAMINASPEPFSNVAASFSEDVVVLGGLWMMFAHPWLMLALLLLLVIAAAWLLPRLWRGIVALIRGFSLPRPTAGSNT